MDKKTEVTDFVCSSVFSLIIRGRVQLLGITFRLWGKIINLKRYKTKVLQPLYLLHSLLVSLKTLNLVS